MVYHITPFYKNDIGCGLNRHIELLPDDSWICVRDQDTLLFEDAGMLIENIAANTDYSLIGSVTNRLRDTRQLYRQTFSYDDSITTHQKIAKHLYNEHGQQVTPVTFDIGGFFMLFPKSIWNAVGGFAEKSILFDRNFTKKVKKIGKVGIAQGLYTFHLYRWGKADPINSTNHLRLCK